MVSTEEPRVQSSWLANAGPALPLRAPLAELPLPARHHLVAFECSLATTSLDALEALDRRVTPEQLKEVFGRTKAISELVVLRTCHRFEVYCWTSAPPKVSEALEGVLGHGADWRTHQDDSAVQHLFRVAAGLESMALGEREVRDQVRSASRKVLSRYPRPVLRPLILRAVQTAERLAPSVPSSRSMAALAASRVLEETAQPFPRILVVGTGVVGRQVAELLAPYGRVTLVYRTRAPDAEFLRATAARATPWECLADELALADVVVTAVKTGGRIIGPEALESRRRPLVMVDLGLPRNVDPALRDHPSVRLLDLEQLHSRLPGVVLTDFEETVETQALATANDLVAKGFESWVDAYRRESERIRAELLSQAHASLASLTEAERETIDRLTRRLVARLLAGPTQGLRSIPPGSEGNERRRWAAELLRLTAPRS